MLWPPPGLVCLGIGEEGGGVELRAPGSQISPKRFYFGFFCTLAWGSVGAGEDVAFNGQIVLECSLVDVLNMCRVVR